MINAAVLTESNQLPSGRQTGSNRG